VASPCALGLRICIFSSFGSLTGLLPTERLGGFPSLAQAATDPAVTEVTAGSGLLQSHLFDYFEANANVCAFAYGAARAR
jgi:hypothetical protein